MLKAYLALSLALVLPLKAEVGKVVSVHDGDTITVLLDTKASVKVRLWGIDAPELKQDYGNKAREALSDLLAGKRVDFDAKQKDRYGRIVSKVTLLTSPKNKDVGAEMLGAGFAWWYVEYAKKAEDYAKLEKGARDTKKGLWRDLGTKNEPVAPWHWRKINQ